jgi:ribonuclease HI
MRYTVYTDGAARGNPGPAAIGIVVEDDTGRTVYESSKAIGVRTNNEAEYLAFIAALQYLRESRVVAADFRLDSELVVRQLLGQYRVKEPRLQSLHGQAVMLLNAVPTRTIQHIPRSRNARADELANEALDAEGTSPPVG